MTYQSKSSSKRRRDHTRHTRKEEDQVYRITGASESLIADSERKNRLYAVMIGVRIASLFVVLFTEGWVQIAVFVTGMLAPWVGVQIANTLRQVQTRSIETVQPQQAALEVASGEAEADEDTVIIGDVVTEESSPETTTPSAESSATAESFDDNGGDSDEKGS